MIMTMSELKKDIENIISGSGIQVLEYQLKVKFEQPTKNSGGEK